MQKKTNINGFYLDIHSFNKDVEKLWKNLKNSMPTDNILTLNAFRSTANLKQAPQYSHKSLRMIQDVIEYAI